MTDKTIIKMRITQVADYIPQGKNEIEGQRITAACVYDQNDETNKQWSKWTPSGDLSFYVTNPHVIGKYKRMDSVYVTLEHVPEFETKDETPKNPES